MQRKSSSGQEVFWDAKELALPVYGNILPRNAPQLAGPEPAEPLVRHLIRSSAPSGDRRPCSDGAEMVLCKQCKVLKGCVEGLRR